MTQEWSDPYNSFNSYKGLLFRKQFDGIISGEFLPPIEVNIDPCNNCNIHCIWCNGKKVINRNEKVMMSTSHLLELIDFCADWGVKAICFAGGGEPTMHPDLDIAFQRIHELGMESAIITNGLFDCGREKEEKKDILLEAVAKYARWIGISVDADCAKTYKRCKGIDKFDVVIDNINKLVGSDAREVTYKYLVHPENQYGIYEACRLAKYIGADCFHSRLVSDRYLSNDTIDKKSGFGMASVFHHDIINQQMELCQELNSSNSLNSEDGSFKVFTIKHKQEGSGNRRIRFDKCRASPLLCMFEADGTTSICIDRKGVKDTMLCSHENVENVRDMWGSHYHKKLLYDINPETDCPKCTMNIYQELLNAYEKDSFCMNFP